MARKLTGIRKWKGGWQAYVQVNGRSYSKSYPLTTPLEELRDWREAQKKRYGTPTPAAGSFAADIVTYLSRIAALPSHRQFTEYLARWADALGRDRPRRTITATELDQTLQRWALDGVSVPVLRKRRTALMALWHRLDGKSAANPVRDTHAPRLTKPEARGLSYDTIARIFAQMPESRTKRRLVVIAYTGLPPSMLAQVTRSDLDLTAGTVRVRPRRKGAGVEARTLPLIPDGVRAFKAFHAANAYGPFAGRAANRVFQRACHKADVSGATLYDLRHSFGAALYLATRDLATVARFLLHSTTMLTERYAQAAMQDVDRAAALALGRNLSRIPVQLNKSRKRRHLRKVS